MAKQTQRKAKPHKAKSTGEGIQIKAPAKLTHEQAMEQATTVHRSKRPESQKLFRVNGPGGPIRDEGLGTIMELGNKKDTKFIRDVLNRAWAEEKPAWMARAAKDGPYRVGYGSEHHLFRG